MQRVKLYDLVRFFALIVVILEQGVIYPIGLCIVAVRFTRFNGGFTTGPFGAKLKLMKMSFSDIFKFKDRTTL